MDERSEAAKQGDEFHNVIAQTLDDRVLILAKRKKEIIRNIFKMARAPGKTNTAVQLYEEMREMAESQVIDLSRSDCTHKFIESVDVQAVEAKPRDEPLARAFIMLTKRCELCGRQEQRKIFHRYANE